MVWENCTTGKKAELKTVKQIYEQSISWSLTVGTRLPSSLDPNEEERVQGVLLIQKAWMFAWLVHAELTAETARDWPVQARGHPFQVQLSSSVRFLRPTVTRVLCASATGRVHSSREGEPLSEDIALLLLAESHQWQPPRPGTPFSGPRPGSPFRVPQWDDDILSQWGKSLPHRPGTPFRGRRPGTPFSVSQGIDDSAPQWETYLTSTKLPRDFAPPGVLRLARHKFRCQKPYKDKTAKIPYAVTADSLRNLRALIKTTSSKKTLGPLKELKEIKEGQVLLPPEVPDCRSNPLSREPRPSVLPPATRKRGASTSVHRPRKVQRILDMSTVFEEPMDFDHSGTRVSATSPRHYAWDASEKVNEDDRVPGPSSADSSTDQRGLEKFPPSLSYSGHLPNLPEDEEDSSPEQGILEHVLPAQGFLETSCSPGVPLQKPLLSPERPLDLSIPTQGNAGTSQSAQGLQRFLPSTHKYLENSPSAFEPLEHLPVAPKARGLSTLSQETPSPLLPVHGTLELPQYGSEAVPSMPSVQGLQGSLSPLERSIAPVLSVHGSLGHSLSAQDPTETYKSTKATPGQSLSSLDDMSPFMSSQETLGPLSSVEVDVGTYSHNTGSPGQLKNISGFPGSMISDHDPVLISLPAQGTLRHLPSAKEDVGLSLSTQQAPELSTLEQGSIQHVEASKVALVNPSSPKRATGKLQCAQYALEHLPPSEGALQHSSTHQGTQESLKSSLESLEILSSNSEHVKNSLSATGGLESSLSGSRVLGYELADKHPEQHSIYSEKGSLGNPLSTQEVQEHLVPLKGNLKSCQSAKEGQKTLIPSQIVLESVPSISEDLEALSSALERMRISPLANESLENSQYAESVVESSSSATGTLRTTFAQKSLENSLPGKGMREILSSSQGALKVSSTKGRVENVSSLERSMKPPTSLQEPSRPYSLIQGTHQHPLPAQGPLGPVQTDSGIHGPFLTPEAGGNLSREPGSCKSFPLTPETLDHLQSAEGPDDLSMSAHEMFDPLPPTQGTLGILVYSSGLMEPSESEHRKLGHVSSVEKDGEISPFEKPTKSTSPLTSYLPFNREVLESSSCGLGAPGSLLSAREDAKDTASAPHAQEPSLSTSQALEHFVTTQGPLQINTPNKQTLCSLTSRVEDVEHSIFSPEVRKESQMLPNVLDHLSNRGESQEFSFSAPGTKNISLLAPETLEHSSLENATQATSHCPQEVVGSLLSVQGSLGQSPSDHGSLGPLASTLGAGRPSLSEADPIQLSASAPVTKAHLTPSLGPSASKYHDQMEVGILPALHGDLEASQSDQRTVEMTKIAEGALENVSVAQRTTKLSTCSQEANKSSLSYQGHLLHSAHVKEALIPALSDQETKESLLSPSKDTEHPPSSVSVQMQEPSLSTLGPQDSLLTPPKPRKLSISVSDSRCPFTSSQESGTETVALSTLSPEYLEPIQSAQGQLEYFSTTEQGNEHSSTASQTTTKLFSPQECGGHLSSDPSVQEPFQSGPMDVATLLSSQGPQKPFKLTEALLYPSTSGQECQEHSESSQDVMGTHESSESTHGYILPEVEPVVTFTAVSGTTVTSPSAPQPLELSSLLHVTSATSLTDQRVVGPRPPSQRTLEVLSLAQGTLEPLASPQGNERNSHTLTPGLSSLTQESPVPSPSLQKDDEFCLSSQATLEVNTSGQETLNPSPTTQVPEKASLYTKPSLAKPTQAQGTEGHPASKLGTIQSTQKELGFSPHAQTPLIISLSTQGTLGSCSPDQGDLGTSLSVQGSLKLSTPTQGIVETVPSVQSTLTHPTSSQVDPRFSPLAQHTVQDSASSPRTTGLFQSSQKPQGSFLSSPEHIEHLPSAASAQENLLSNPGTLQVSAHSKAVPEPHTNSQFTQVTRGTFPSVPGHLGLLSSTQTTPSSSCSDVTTVRTCPSSEKTTQGALESSSASQGTGEFLLSAKGTMGNSTSAKQSVGPFPSTTEPLRSIQNTQTLLGSLQSGQSSLGVSRTAEGPVDSSLFPQGSLDLSVSAQGTLATLLCNQGTRKHPASSQTPQNTSQSVQNSLQYPPSVPGSLKPSKSEKSTLGSLSSHAGIGISSPGSQEMFQLSARSGHPETLLYFGLPLELSMCAQGTLCPFSSPQGKLDPLHCFSGNLESSQPAQMNVSHLSSVREPVGNSPSVPGPREPSPFNQVPRRLSSHVPGDPASLISDHLPLELNVSAQCSLSPSSKGTPGFLLSSANIQGKVQNTQSYHGQLSHIRETSGTSPSHVRSLVHEPCPQETLGLYSLGQGSQATSQCAQGTVGSCLSPQESMELSTSAQRSLGHLPPAQGLSGTSSHTQHTCSQSTSAQSTAAYSSPTQYLSQHAKKTVETLKSDPGFPIISITAQASVEPLLTPQESPRYSSSLPGVCKTSTATRGHVVSDDGPLERSISAQANLSPLHSSQCLLKPSLSVEEGTFGLSTPMHGTLGPSVSSLGHLGSWQSAQSVQQTNPSASDSLGSMPSSKGQTVISLSGQGTLSSFLEPLKISLSVQVSSRPSLSLQEPGGSCLSSHGENTLEVSTCAYSNLVLSNSSRGDLGSSSSTPVTLGSSPPAKVDLGKSPSVSWTLTPPVSAQGVQGTSTSAQEVRKPSLDSQGRPEPLPYAQDDLGLGSLSLGTEGNSQFSKEEFKVLPSAHGGFKPALSTPGSVEKLLSASRTQRLFSSTVQDAGSFSLSSKNNSELSISSKKHLASSPTTKTSLKHSPSSQESWGPTPTTSDTLEHSLQDQGWQKPSVPTKVTLGQTPHQKGYEGNSLSVQGTVKLSISGQESLGPCSFDQGSPKSSTSSHKVQDPSYNQGSVAQFPSVPGDTPSLSAQGMLQNLSSSKVTLETSSSLQKAREGLLDVHGAQQLQAHSPGADSTTGSPYARDTEPLSSTKETFNISDSSPGTSETFPSIPGSLEISFSAQSSMGPSVSEKEIIGSSVSLEESLGPSFPDKGSLRSTPPASGTGSLSPSEQGCQEISSRGQGNSPSQQCYTGNPLHSQEALCLSISAQESLEYSPFAQGLPDTSLSSQEASGPSLDFVSLGHSPSDPGMLGRSDSDDRTLENPPFTQSILEIQFSNNGVTETSTTSQDSLGHLPPSVQNLQPSLIPETSEPLPTAKEVLYDQGNLEPSTPLHNTIGNPKPSQSVLEPISSTQKGVGTFFSTEFLGLSTCAHDDFIPIHSHRDRLRYSAYPNKSHRHSNSTKKNRDIRYSLLELDALRSFPSAKSRLTSSIYVRKDSSSTSTPPRSVSPPASSELTFRSSSPPKEDLRCSPSPRGSSRHSKSKKTKLKQAPKESGLKSVPSEDEGMKFHHSPTRVGRDLVSNKVGARLKTEPKESLTTTSAKGGCRSSQSHEGGLRCSPSPEGSPRCSRSTKIKLEQVPANKADVHVSHSEHEGCKLRSLSKIESKHSSSKRDQKQKATHHECIEPSISKGGFRSSRSHEKGGRSSASPQTSHKCSRSIKTKLEQAPSNKAEVHASHTEHEDCKHLSLSQIGFSHASSAKRDKKPDTTPQQSIEASTSTEEDIGTTPSHEETLRHSTSPHGTSSLTSTSPRTRLRHFPYTQEVIETSTEAQESFRSSPDGGSPRGSVKSSSLSQSNDVRHPVSTKEDVKHTLSIQEGHKPSTGAREGSGTWIPVRRGLMYPPIPKGSGASFPVVQGNFRHTRPQLADLRSSLSYQGKDTAFQYEHGTPICDPSVLGGHRYSHSGCQTKSALYHQVKQVSDIHDLP
ncbi:hypothetical protein ACRRTK_001853 [Alexandromys fortis]